MENNDEVNITIKKDQVHQLLAYAIFFNAFFHEHNGIKIAFKNDLQRNKFDELLSTILGPMEEKAILQGKAPCQPFHDIVDKLKDVCVVEHLLETLPDTNLN